MLTLPDDDRSLSPYTGWTRAHWEAAADGLLAAVEPYRSHDRSLIDLPGRASWSRCDGLEGYARTFLLAAFRVAGGGDPALLEPYAEGLATGPLGSWQPVVDRSQPIVEAASIAIGLRLTRDRLWDGLPASVQERTLAWLGDALTRETADNNWHLFPVTVAGLFRDLGLDDLGATERGLARIEGWYEGDGWYRDGIGRNFDHYNGWAMHLYPALHAYLGGPAEPYASRLRAFLTNYGAAFDANGSPVYHGRSVIYRFAAAAPVWAGELLGVSPYSSGTARRLASGAASHFLSDGRALSREGLLTLGWYGPHEPSLQPYSGSASPYWASKGFLGLLLPPDHPAWTSVEEPGPAERADQAIGLPGPGLLIHSTAADGLVRLVNHGSDHQPPGGGPDDPLYQRMAYSTRTGPTTPGSAGSAAGTRRNAPGGSAAAGQDVPADNHVGLVIDGEVTPRGPITPMGAGRGWAASSCRPTPTTLIESVSVVHGPHEVRLHRVTAPSGTAVRQTGWAVTGELTSGLLPLHGFTGATELKTSGGTVFGPDALVPALDGVVLESGALFACLVTLSAAPVAEAPPVFRLDGTRATLTWPDDTVHEIGTEGGLTLV
ncbi:DUF2264 domain-containing protein [Nonomuraea sp. bgisy101]|uniref:DUF2264 domain-containing protein n=1 Tax=Nonomuraea sp. bgisy101 TaxID=3413784 RepID=UPI003D73062E